MTRTKKFTLAALTALALAAGAFATTPAAQIAKASPKLFLEAKVNEYEGQHRVAGDPSQWRPEARKVNEYEGQHRSALNFTKIEYNSSNQG